MMKSIRLMVGMAVTTGVMLGLASIPAHAQVNILVNPGFETGSLAPWFQNRDFAGGGENWNVTNSDAHTGTFSATDRGNKELRQNFAPVLTNLITEVSFWEKQTNGFISAYDYIYSDSTDQEFFVHPTQDWQFFDVTSNLAPGKSLVAFTVFGVSGGGTDRTFLDDVSIKANVETAVVPEPGSLALLATGGLPLLGFLRRKVTGA